MILLKIRHKKNKQKTPMHACMHFYIISIQIICKRERESDVVLTCYI